MSYSLKTILPALALLVGQVTITQAHDFVNHWNVNGEDRVAFDPFSPGKLTAQRATNNAMLEWDAVDSPESACGGVADSALVESWPLDAGSTVTVFWNNWPVHPVLEYMAYCGETCQGVASASLDWFKISEEGWTGSDWVSNDITNRPGHDRSFVIPADLAPGAYLVRHEILALHQRGKPQAYPVCFQAQLAGTGTARPTDTAKFPEVYTINPAFKTYNVFDMSQDHSQFIFPGPPVYGGGAGPATEVSTTSVESTSPDLALPSAVSSAPDADESSDYDAPAPSSAEPTLVESVAAPPASSPAVVVSGGNSAPAPTSPPPSADNGGQSACIAMNDCKDKANKLPNAQVSAAMSACDAEYKC